MNSKPSGTNSVSILVFGKHIALGRKLVQVLEAEISTTKTAELIWLCPAKETPDKSTENVTYLFPASKEKYAALNQAAACCKNDIILFFSDLVEPKDALEAFRALPNVLEASALAAVSPYVVTHEGSILYAGQPFSEAVFYGYPRNDGTVSPTGMLNIEPVCPQADSLAPDCFAIYRNALQKAGGFDAEKYPEQYAVLDLCCRMGACGFAKSIAVGLVNFTYSAPVAFGSELMALARSHSQKFTRTSEEMQSGLLCPALAASTPAHAHTALLVAHELSLTGAPTVLLDLAIELRELGWQVLFAACKDGPLAQRVLAEGFPLLFSTNWAVGRFLPEHQQDYGRPFFLDGIVDAFNKTVFCSLVLSNLVLRYDGGPASIYWWIHETEQFWGMGFAPEKVSPNITVWAGGPYVKDVMKRFAPDIQPKILTYGVRDRANDYPPKTGHADGLVRFIMPSAVQMRKGHDVVLEAIMSLPMNILQQIEVTFVGALAIADPALSDDVRVFCSIWPCVKHIPDVDREKLFELYQECDVILCPSRDDPMPVILAEGMMFCKIPLCSENTGTSYYLKDGYNGFIVPTGDSAALAECITKIVKLHKTPELNAIAARSRRVFEERFESSIFTNELKKYFPI